MKHTLAVGLVICGLCGSAFAQAPTTQPLVSANSLTFQLDDAPPREAFEKLAAEAHLTLDSFSQQAWRGRDDVRITTSFDHATFWEAAAELARKTSTAPSWDNGRLSLRQDGGTWLHQPAVVVGPLRISMQAGISRHALLISRTPTQENSAFLTVGIANEPNSPVAYTSEFKVLSVTDRQGKPIKAEVTSHPNPQPFNRSHVQVDLKLGEPTDDIKGVGEVKMSFFAAVAKFQTVEIPNLREASNLTRDLGDKRLTVTYRQQAGNSFAVDLHLDTKSNDQAAWNAVAPAVSSSSVRVLDTSGKVMQSNGWGSGFSSKSVTRNLMFGQQRAGSDPADKLIWEVPTSVQLVPVTVEFKDLAIQ